MVLLFNFFNMVDKEEVHRRVKALQEKHPDLSQRQLCDLIIAGKSRYCGVSGALTALPATVPMVGTVITLVGGTALDLAAVGYFMTEMILEMSVVYGRNIRLPGVSREALWVMASAVSADMANKTVSSIAIKQMNNQVFVHMAREVLVALGIKATQRTVIKIIPFLGAIISGSVNYFICRRMGKIAADYYENNSFDQWAKDSIEIEGEVID